MTYLRIGVSLALLGEATQAGLAPWLFKRPSTTRRPTQASMLHRTAAEAVDDEYVDEQGSLNMVEMGDAWAVMEGHVNKEVILGILDGGVDITHPEFEHMLWDNHGSHGWNFHDDNDDLTDIDGHGTIMAGIPSAQLNNSIGIAGVCGFPGTLQLMVLKSSNAQKEDISALLYAVAHKADVVLIAWGWHIPSYRLLHAMWQAAHAGVFFVIAAGNDETNEPRFPCAYDMGGQSLCVAGTGTTKQLLPHSNWGPHVDIAAPGYAICSTAYAKVGHRYSVSSGTSVAAALVAGVVATLLAVGVKSEHIRQTIMQNADALDDIKRPIKGGFINAKKAMLAAVSAQAKDGLSV